MKNNQAPHIMKKKRKTVFHLRKGWKENHYEAKMDRNALHRDLLSVLLDRIYRFVDS